MSVQSGTSLSFYCLLQLVLVTIRAEDRFSISTEGSWSLTSTFCFIHGLKGKPCHYIAEWSKCTYVPSTEAAELKASTVIQDEWAKPAHKF